MVEELLDRDALVNVVEAECLRRQEQRLRTMERMRVGRRRNG
jgi:hypothetical protein